MTRQHWIHRAAAKWHQPATCDMSQAVRSTEAWKDLSARSPLGFHQELGVCQTGGVPTSMETVTQRTRALTLKNEPSIWVCHFDGTFLGVCKAPRKLPILRFFSMDLDLRSRRSAEASGLQSSCAGCWRARRAAEPRSSRMDAATSVRSARTELGNGESQFNHRSGQNRRHESPPK